MGKARCEYPRCGAPIYVGPLCELHFGTFQGSDFPGDVTEWLRYVGYRTRHVEEREGTDRNIYTTISAKELYDRTSDGWELAQVLTEDVVDRPEPKPTDSYYGSQKDPEPSPSPVVRKTSVYLIRQCEQRRAARLEREMDGLRRRIMELGSKIRQKDAEIEQAKQWVAAAEALIWKAPNNGKRTKEVSILRKALTFYADEHMYGKKQYRHFDELENDKGRTARAALKRVPQ